MAWIYLIIAISFEVTGTTLLKLSDGMQNLKYSGAMLLCYIASLSFMSLTLKKIEVGITYAIWAGAGIVLITAIGIFFFGESTDWKKIFFIALILTGAVGLNLTQT